MGMDGQRHVVAALRPGKRLSTHCTGGWVGATAGLGGCRKSRIRLVFNHRTVQPVAGRYTEMFMGTLVSLSGAKATF
jgi:hypothetical protein